MAYSSIEEEQRPKVIRRCYWPLLRLAREMRLPLGIEASGFTLETIQAIDPGWIQEFKSLVTHGPCEFIGSGYAQIIGPLVPAEVNAANLRIGHEVYERLLGFRPQIALINEQAYSAGLVELYVESGFQAIIMEWDNPARTHPEWNSEWRYLPQYACGPKGEKIALIWNKSAAFQKFQHYAHSEIDLDEYLAYLHSHRADQPRAFPLYGNDIEVFDFRPNRYLTETDLSTWTEWDHVEKLFVVLQSLSDFRFIRPSQVLELMGSPGSGNELYLESAEQPIPVKKQSKYNISRWAITGRDDLGINTACWRIFEVLKEDPQSTEEDWRELCYLWSSDFRTHITEKRWHSYRQRLAQVEEKKNVRGRLNFPVIRVESSSNDHPSNVRVGRSGRFLLVESDLVKVQLNCRRGLAIGQLWFKSFSEDWLCGTLHHSFYDDIDWAADFYTGHLVFESPGQAKITDLNPVDPIITYEASDDSVLVTASIPVALGRVQKQIKIFLGEPRVDIRYHLDWSEHPLGSLRLGYVTLNPDAFDWENLLFRTHNGGEVPETFPILGANIDHGSPVSFLVSARSLLGMTEGWVEIGDHRHALRVSVPRHGAALMGMIKSQRIGSRYFYRFILTVQEMDETSRSQVFTDGETLPPQTYIISIAPSEVALHPKNIQGGVALVPEGLI